MTTLRVARQKERLFSTDRSQCGTCRGCTRLQPAIELPVASDRAEISLSRTAIYKVLFHSWMLPLIGLVTVAMICSILQVADTQAIGLSLLGFVLGLAGCVNQPATLLKIEEVP